MRFHINGLNRETGAPVSLQVEAANEEEAVRKVGHLGVVVESVLVIPTVQYQAPPHPPAASPPPPAEELDVQYRVVPFVANITHLEGAGAAASQLQSLINKFATAGWTYVRLEHVETDIRGNPGCFGIGYVPDRVLTLTMVVFKK